MPELRERRKAPDGTLIEWDGQGWLPAQIAPAAPVPTNDGSVLAMPNTENVGRFLSNAGEMINPIAIAKGLYQTARHPYDTGAAILQQSGKQFDKATTARREGRYAEMVGHGLGSIPVVGPIAAEAGEQIASGDVAGGLGKAVGMMVPFGAAEGVARVGVKAVPKRVVGALESGATERYADVMRPKAGSQAGRRLGNKADRVAGEIAADPTNVAWSRQGLANNVGSKLDEAITGLDAASDARLSARTFKTDEIIAALKKQRQRWVSESVDASQPAREVSSRTSQILDPQGKPVVVNQSKAVPVGRNVTPGPNQARVSQIDSAIAELEALGPDVRYESLRRIREAYDKPARIKYNPSMTDDFLKKTDEASGAADVTGTLREHLAKFDPETAKANAAYSLYKSADDALTAAIEIDKAKPKVGRQIMTRLTTTLMGGQQAGVGGAVAGFTLAPVADAMVNAGFTTKLQTAKAMNDLATAIRGGDVGRVNSLSFRIRQLIKQAEATRSRGSVALEPSTEGSR